MEVYSIGFTQKTAEQFFGILKKARIRRVLDIRLSNVSQLAGFTKRDDLRFFLKEICRADYIHEPMLAPSQEIFEAYKRQKGSWSDFEPRFVALMAERAIEKKLDRSLFSVPTVLLCSEPLPEHCHRSLVLKYLSKKWGGLKITHL